MNSLHHFNSNGLPSDWKVVPLAEFGYLSDGDWILNQHYSNDGVRLLQVGDVGVGGFEDKSRRFISRATADALKCTVLQHGQVLISRMPDPIGRACLVPTLPYPAITAVDVAILSPRPDLVDRNFAVMVLNSDINLNQCQSLATGVTRQRVSRSNLARVELPLPPLAEQRKIAAVLGLAQRAMEQQERLLALTTELKKALLHHLFTHGSRHENQQHTEIGSFPESWELRAIGDLDLDIGDGNYSTKYPKKEAFLPTGVPFLRANNVVDGRLSWNDMRYISPELHAELRKGHTKKDDVCLVTRGNIGEVAYVTDDFVGANMNAQLVRLNGRDVIDGKFLYFALALIRRLKSNSTRSKVGQHFNNSP
jgi:type I restriction enzyme, S subunit